MPFFPPSVFAWDDASNNKALISGQSALIFNAPSAWAVAKRDAPKVAEQLWTFPPPKGPKGRHVSGRYRYWGIWNFSANKSAAKSLLLYLSTREAIGKLLDAGQGFDVPPFEKLIDFGVWAEAEPPKGTLYNFPPRGEVIVSVAGYPAPAKIGVQMYSQGIDVQDDRAMHPAGQIDRRGDRLRRSASSKATCAPDRAARAMPARALRLRHRRRRLGRLHLGLPADRGRRRPRAAARSRRLGPRPVDPHPARLGPHPAAAACTTGCISPSPRRRWTGAASNAPAAR